jgi:hypothetical protein
MGDPGLGRAGSGLSTQLTSQKGLHDFMNSLMCKDLLCCECFQAHLKLVVVQMNKCSHAYNSISCRNVY